jgi:hypothetical protein
VFSARFSAKTRALSGAQWAAIGLRDRDGRW